MNHGFIPATLTFDDVTNKARRAEDRAVERAVNEIQNKLIQAFGLRDKATNEVIKELLDRVSKSRGELLSKQKMYFREETQTFVSAIPIGDVNDWFEEILRDL